MKALFKYNDSGKCAVAMGDCSMVIAMKIGMALGETIVCNDFREVAKRIREVNLACLIIPMRDPDAALGEALAGELSLDARMVVCAPRDHKKHYSLEFFMVCTSFSYFKLVYAAVRDSQWRFWELDQEGESVHEKYRKLLNRVSDGIVRFNSETVVTFANKSFCRWLEVKSAVGLRAADIFDEKSVAALMLCIGHLRCGVILPLTVRLKNGSMLLLDPTPRFRFSGEYSGMLALLRMRDADSEITKIEYEAGRTTHYLFSLTAALNATFDIKSIIDEVIKAILGLCGEVAIGVLADGVEPVYHEGPVFVNVTVARAMADFCARLPRDKNIKVIVDTGTENDPIISTVKSCGCTGAVCVELHANEERLGCIWIMLPKKLEGMRELGSVLINTGALAGMALRNALNVRTMISEQRERRRFYSDALAAVTDNKLILCEYDEFERYWESCEGKSETLELTEAGDVAEARHLVEAMLSDNGVPDDIVYGMITCVSEAATNVIKYGPPGKMQVKLSSQRIRVRFNDKGQGIAVSKLPKAILMSGYSESQTPSLGLGFSVMLKLCTSLRIATGHSGTYLLLEADAEKREIDPIANFITFA